MERKTTFLRSNIVLGALISLFFINTGVSQEVKVYELFEDSLTSTVSVASKTVSKTATIAAVTETTYEEDLNNFYELNFNLIPTIYIKNNSIVQIPNNESPLGVNLEDTNSFNVLKSNNPLFKTVELIVVNAENSNDFNNVFDASTLQGFNNLKYIYVQCLQFNTSVAQIQKFVINVESDITVYFMTVNPS